MNRMQKISWLMVISTGSGFVLSAIMVTIGYFAVGFPKAWSGLGFLGLAGIGGLGQIIFKKDPGPVQGDERDRYICLQAARWGFAGSYLVMGVLCMGIWTYYHGQGIEAIDIDVLPLVWGLAAMTMFFAHSLMILVLYGKDKKAVEEANPRQ